MQRLRIATFIGLLGALAVIVGVVLPWITVTTAAFGGEPASSLPSVPAQSFTLNGLVAGNAFVMLLGVALGIAASWLWAGEQPRKAIAVLGPTAIAVVAFAAWAITDKGNVLGIGPTDPGQTTSLGVGVYTTLAGGFAALVAAALALIVVVRSEREAAHTSIDVDRHAETSA